MNVREVVSCDSNSMLGEVLLQTDDSLTLMS